MSRGYKVYRDYPRFTPPSKLASNHQHMNTISDLIKIAEIKSADAAEAQKFAATVKELTAVCEKNGFKSLEEFLEKAEEFKSGNLSVSTKKQVKPAGPVAKAAKTPRKRATITQEMVDQMKVDSAAGLTANQIAKKLGVSSATFNSYKAKEFKFDPKPKGRKKTE